MYCTVQSVIATIYNRLDGWVHGTLQYRGGLENKPLHVGLRVMTPKANQVLGVSGLSRSGRQQTPLRRRSCYVIEAAQPALIRIHFAGLAA